MNNINYIINLQLKDNKISAKVKNLQVNFSALDNSVNKVSQTVNAASADISTNITEVNTSIKGINTVVEQTTNNISNQLKNVNFISFVDMIRNGADAFKSLSGSGIGFEQSMADLSSITGIVGNELKDLGEVARQTGKDSGLGAAGAADAFALLASQIQVDKIGLEGLKILQKETITLAQAAGMGMSDAATAMAATINQFGLEATDANRVINVLAAGSKYGAAEITDLAQSFKVTGAVAAAAGLSVEQSAGAIEVLSKSNLKGAEAGTALRNIIVKMQTTLGLNLGETGLSTALEGLKPKLNDVTFLAKTFGAENLAAAQFLITNAAAVDEMTTAVTGTNVAQEQAAIRTNTTAEQLKRMQATIDDLKIGFFEASGGMTAYIAAVGDSAIVVAQMIPLFSAMKSGLMLIATANGRATITTIAKSVAEKAGAIATGLMTVAQAALNAVMNLNPIALVVTAIAALVAGFIYAYNNCESFRKVVDIAWESVKKFALAIWNGLVKAFEKVSSVLAPIWSKLKALLGIEEEITPVTEQASIATKELGNANDSATGSVNLLTEQLGNQNKKLNTNLATLDGVEQKISDLKTAQKSAMVDQAIALGKEIRLWEKKQEAMKNAITIGAAKKPELTTLLPSQKTYLTAPAPKSSKKDNAFYDGTQKITIGGIDLATTSMTGLKKITEQTSTSIKNQQLSWKDWGENLSKMYNPVDMLRNGLSSLASNMISSLGQGADSMAAFGEQVANTMRETIGGLLSLGISYLVMNAMSTAASFGPFGFLAAAGLAALAGGLAKSVFNSLVPAFANGGLVYGDTLARVGEYPGAANNPEVIAPLSKLKNMLSPQGFAGGDVEFFISGNALKGILRKVNNIDTRTR